MKIVKYELQKHLDEILQMKKNGMLNRQIAEIFNTSASSINRLLRSNGIFLRPKFKDSDIQIVIDEYVNKKMSIPKIAAKHHKQTNFISNLLKQNGIEIQGSTVRNRIYQINQNFFNNVDTPQKAYCLGIIYADGWVSKGKLSLRLQCGDKYLLQNILQLMDSNHPLHFVDYHNKYIINDGYQRQDQWGFTISNRTLCNDLARYGVVQNKSLIIQYPELLPDNLFPHFLRGLFDGDGYISHKLNTISITGCKYLLFEIKQRLQSLLDVKIQVYDASCRNGNTKVIQTTSFKNSKRILDFMYDSSTIHLKRKYDIYKERYLTDINSSN